MYFLLILISQNIGRIYSCISSLHDAYVLYGPLIACMSWPPAKKLTYGYHAKHTFGRQDEVMAGVLIYFSIYLKYP